jgi:hypothetical protein
MIVPSHRALACGDCLLAPSLIGTKIAGMLAAENLPT